MNFAAPEWFLVLPAALVAGWFWRRLRLFSPLRLAILVLATLALAEPRIAGQQDRLDLWVLLDRSDSTEDLVDRGLPEWQRLLEDARPSGRDRLILHDYAAEIVEHGADGTRFTGSRKLTRTALALSHVAALREGDRPSRVLLFTDGYATEPLGEAARHLEAAGIPLDFRLIRDETLDDFRLAALELPGRVQAGEPFLISVTVRGSLDTVVPLVIRRDGQTLLEKSVELHNGVGRAEFTDRLARGGSFRYEAELIPETDAHPGNNRQFRWIEVSGGPRVLLVSRYPNDPVAAALASRDFEVDLVSEPRSLGPGRLSGARAVIFHNVPAHEVPQDFLDALDFFVREQAGGFLMIGGKHSFGSGGYFRSSIDPLLPVSMELKNEHRKLSVALAVVLDRSGSMSVNVSGGGNATKMDLANSGTAEAIRLLGTMDQVCLFAVDSAPHEIIPMTKIGARADELANRAMSVKSMGGGIYVYEGLKAAWDQLQGVSSGTRHIILFSDAADSEEPGAYRDLLADMQAEGATVSVIGLGTRSDPDAALLEEIARLGGGRVFFSDRPLDIPKIFAQETVTVARSTFLDEPVATLPTGRWGEVSPRPLEWPGEIDGYNVSYLREDASSALIGTDEYAAPLVAHARRGLGRSAAVTFPLGGDFSARARAWPDYGNFLQTMTRWLMGLDLPPGIGLSHQLEGTRLGLDLRYDPELWDDRLAGSPPTLRLIEQETGAVSEVPWQRIEPGHFSAARDLPEGSVVRGALQVGPHALPFGPVTVGTSIEWDFDPARISELRSLAASTGGRELLDLSQAWVRPPLEQERSLRGWLLGALLGFLLVEALVTRTGWRWPLLSSSRREQAAPAMPKRRATSPRPSESPEPAAESPAPTKVAPDPENQSQQRRSRYQRAKKRL